MLSPSFLSSNNPFLYSHIFPISIILFPHTLIPSPSSLPIFTSSSFLLLHNSMSSLSPSFFSSPVYCIFFLSFPISSYFSHFPCFSLPSFTSPSYSLPPISYHPHLLSPAILIFLSCICSLPLSFFIFSFVFFFSPLFSLSLFSSLLL